MSSRGIGFRPLNGQVIVEPIEEHYTGRIILPDNRKKARPVQGIVRAMGPGMLMKTGARWPMPNVRVGQTIIYRPEGSQDFELDGVKLVAVRDSSVMAVIEEEEKAAE